MRSLISELELLDTQTEKAVAAIMVTHERARKDVSTRLTRLTCELDDVVVENVHRQMSGRHCMTIFIAEGTVQRIRHLIGRIRGMRGTQQIDIALMPI